MVAGAGAVWDHVGADSTMITLRSFLNTQPERPLAGAAATRCHL
jgi:hypothetical protein